MFEEYNSKANIIHDDCVIGSGVKMGYFNIIGHGCVIGKNVTIGCGVIIGNYTVIGEGSVIKSGCHIGSTIDVAFSGDRSLLTTKVIYPKGSIYIGNHVILNDYVVIEQPFEEGGKVVIEDDCSIGAFCYIKHHAYIHKKTCMFVNCMIGEYAEIDENVDLYANTLVGSHTHLKEGCVGINGALFKNNEEYEGISGYASLPHAMCRVDYKKFYGYGNRKSLNKESQEDI